MTPAIPNTTRALPVCLCDVYVMTCESCPRLFFHRLAASFQSAVPAAETIMRQCASQHERGRARAQHTGKRGLGGALVSPRRRNLM